jgi:tRNA U38,U39,U40 pseudouridine synthase TruA
MLGFAFLLTGHFRYTQRHVAIQLQYDGSKYYGFSAQKDECDETVEKHLFEALLKLRLIESRQV